MRGALYLANPVVQLATGALPSEERGRVSEDFIGPALQQITTADTADPPPVPQPVSPPGPPSVPQASLSSLM